MSEEVPFPIRKASIPEHAPGFALHIQRADDRTLQHFRHFLVPSRPTDVPTLTSNFVPILPRPEGIKPISTFVSDRNGPASASFGLSKSRLRSRRYRSNPSNRAKIAARQREKRAILREEAVYKLREGKVGLESSSNGVAQTPCMGVLHQYVRKTVIVTTDTLHFFQKGPFTTEADDKFFKVDGPGNIVPMHYTTPQELDEAQQEAREIDINHVPSGAVCWEGSYSSSPSSGSNESESGNSNLDSSYQIVDSGQKSESLGVSSSDNPAHSSVHESEVDHLLMDDVNSIGTINVSLAS